MSRSEQEGEGDKGEKINLFTAVALTERERARGIDKGEEIRELKRKLDAAIVEELTYKNKLHILKNYCVVSRAYINNKVIIGNGKRLNRIMLMIKQ